jgi:hypothetical protein
MSGYWATTMILESIARDRQRMIEEARGARPVRYDDAGFVGGAGPERDPHRRPPRPRLRPRRIALRGGPITVSVSIG